jgi:ABC-type transport system involved in cytochrome c biogenesis permease subunit
MTEEKLIMRSITKILMAGAALLLALPTLRAETVPLDTDALATLAVQDHGRKKPFTTFAQEALLTMSGRSTLPVEGGEALAPEEVALDLWFNPTGWDERPVIMVTFRALKEKLGLPLETDKKLFSYKELVSQPAFLELLDSAQKVRQAGEADNLTNLQKEAEHLGERLRLFQDCVNGQKQMIVPNAVSAGGRWSAIQDVMSGVKIWPPTQADAVVADNPATADATRLFLAWAQAYRGGDIGGFNALTPQVVDALRQFAPQFYPAAGTLQFEHHYMTLHPFRWAWIIYLFAIIVLLLTAIWARALGYRLTWALVLLGLGFEVYGLGCRVIISGRPPVTNMYETVIWVSFMGMVFASILEAVYRKRYFFYAGIPASVLTLIIADSQPTILDASINPLTAVLRNNMWLTIHVLTIVSSYAAFVLTAALGHIALAMSLWGKRYAKPMAEMQFFIYRAMQIGVLLLAAGTILGGVWANYSWGRFWGWDPKETWALTTLLCYLAVLHGRLAGWWGGYGLAVGSVVCLLSVMMSWYGVNFVLGKGLHSYGFGTGGFSYVAMFAVFEVVFVAFVVLWNRKRAAAAREAMAREPETELAGQT